MHYHVVENTPGYMPDSDPACFDSKRDAKSFAVSLVNELRDNNYVIWHRAYSDQWFGELRGTSGRFMPGDLGRVVELATMPGGCE